LLDKYSISTKLISYHKFCESKKVELFLDYLSKGMSIALVSDAGTPLISDPGNVLVKEVRKNGFDVIPIVGASAPIALLSCVDRVDEDFKFIGFLPRVKNQIKEIITKNNSENLIFYESPQRLIETLDVICEVNPNKKITIGRELTKKFEEVVTNCVSEIKEYYKNNTLKGEIVALLHKDIQNDELDIDIKIEKLKKLNLKDKEISLILSTLYDVNKNTVYKKCIKG